jgi:sulfur-oxidizing protein SoxB
MDYACEPDAPTGNRISDMRLEDGRAVEANKSYRVAGWASVNPQQGKPVSEIVGRYLRAQKTVKIKRVNRVALKEVDHDPGIGGDG